MFKFKVLRFDDISSYLPRYSTSRKLWRKHLAMGWSTYPELFPGNHDIVSGQISVTETVILLKKGFLKLGELGKDFRISSYLFHLGSKLRIACITPLLRVERSVKQQFSH